jgi:serine phosphatase RsbU (regulator of sigma subunit)
VATFYESALHEAQVGRDFFDTFAVDDGQVALVVGDVSGEGL